MSHAFQLGDTLHEVQLSRTPDGYALHHEGHTLPFALHGLSSMDHELHLGQDRIPLVMQVDVSTLPATTAATAGASN